MSKLNYWNATWSLDEATCPCDVHFLQYLKDRQAKGAAIFHFGTGNHHIVGLKAADDGADNAVLGITASPQEYDDYVELLIQNPRLGRTYKAYFGDIYQLDPRLLPQFDYVTLFHVGEFRGAENDRYGALTDLEMTLLLADRRFARETRTLRLLGVYDPTDGTVFARVVAAVSVRDDVWIEGSGGLFGGAAFDTIGLLTRRDFLYARLKIYF